MRTYKTIPIILLLSIILAGCTLNRDYGPKPDYTAYLKDNKPSVWISDNPRVRKFRVQYSKSRTVETALKRGRRYLPAIREEFRRLRLPMELTYLPMLESMFINRADSGHAKGLWQFTPQTAKEMGLKVGFMVDERLNWRKATRAAAQYLNVLGKKFNYNWALALAAYNGGPNYLQENIHGQRSWDFWDLRLRKETADYVPRFLAMLQVAREKYQHLLPTG